MCSQNISKFIDLVQIHTIFHLFWLCSYDEQLHALVIRYFGTNSLCTDNITLQKGSTTGNDVILTSFLCLKCSIKGLSFGSFQELIIPLTCSCSFPFYYLIKMF